MIDNTVNELNTRFIELENDCESNYSLTLLAMYIKLE